MNATPTHENPSKVCPKCGVEKDLSMFCRNRSKAGGRATYCKQCMHKIKRFMDEMPTPFRPTYSQAQMLQALRAGPLGRTTLDERFSDAGNVLDTLVRKGYVESSGRRGQSRYSLTDAGRAACPPRNPAWPGRPIRAVCQGENVRGPTQTHSRRNTDGRIFNATF